MTTNNYANRFLSWLETGLRRVATQRTQDTLGNRLSYIGASDISESCIRKTVMGKLHPRAKESLSDLLTTERGHWQETGLLAGFQANNAKVIEQLEIAFRTPKGVVCKFHLDFVLVSLEKTVIVESKSYRDRPGAKPRDSHERQIVAQVETLSRLWHKASFRLSSKDKYCSFPELVQRQFGVDLSMIKNNIEGLIMAVGFDQPQPYGPYLPGNNQAWIKVMRKAEAIMAAVNANPARLRYIKGTYPLCDYCSFASSCPKFQGAQLEAYAPTIELIRVNKARLKELEAETKALEKSLANALQNANLTVLNTSEGTFALSQGSTSRIDSDLLTAYLKEALTYSDEQARAVVEACTKRTTFPRNIISGVKKPAVSQPGAVQGTLQP